MFASGALRETVEHGRIGFLVDTVDAMADAIRLAGNLDADLCRAVAKERFTLAAMTDRYIELYWRLAQAGSPRALDGAA